jgi:glyoxylate reductase
MGRIGRAVAVRLKRIVDLDVPDHNQNKVLDVLELTLGASYSKSFNPMLEYMDTIVVTCPSTPGTYHLLSERRFQLLQSHCHVINTSRGNTIDEKELINYLRLRQ